MRLVYAVLIAVTSLLATTDAALTTTSETNNKVTDNRFLRAEAVEFNANNAIVSVERHLVGMPELTFWFKGLPGSKNLGSLFTKLQNQFWLATGKTPDQLKATLGLNRVADMSTHPNYKKWLAVETAYNKKHKISN